MGQKAPTTKALRYYFLSKRPASPQGIRALCTYSSADEGGYPTRRSASAHPQRKPTPAYRPLVQASTRAQKWPVLVTEGSSTGHASDQYW